MGTDDDSAGTDNPAGRLHALLTQLAATPNPKQARIGSRLGEILNVDPSDRAELLRRIAPIYGLPAQIRADVGRLPFDGSSLVARLDAIETALLQMQIGVTVGQWKPHLPDDALHGLTICSSILGQHVADTRVQKKQLDEIHSLVDDVMTSLRDAEDLPVDLHEFLLDHVQQVQYALDLYPVVGSKALEQAFERTVGALVLHPEFQSRGTRSHPVWGRFGKLLAGIGLLFATVNQGTELLQSYFPSALPAASDGVDERVPAHHVQVDVDGADLDPQAAD